MSGELAPSFPDRWVRIMCDDAADAVWNRRGESCDAADLPVTPDFVKRLRVWQEVYDARLDHDDQDEGFDVEAFSAKGLELARDVKRQLPDWTVIYFDEARLGRRGHFPPIQYEVLADSLDTTAPDSGAV